MSEVLQYQHPTTAVRPPFAATLVFWILVAMASLMVILPIIRPGFTPGVSILMSSVFSISAYGLYARKEWARVLLSFLFALSIAGCALFCFASIVAMVWMFLNDHTLGAMLLVVVACALLLCEAASIYLYYEFVGRDMRYWMR